MNLGEKLKAANEAREAEANAAAVRKREQDERKFREANNTILNELQNHINGIVDDIDANHKVKDRKIKSGLGDPWNSFKWPQRKIVGINDAQTAFSNHPHRDALLTFFKWADENGLVGIFEYQHDGGGMDSWYITKVIPK